MTGRSAPQNGSALTLLVLGASGDLTARLLLPGLGGLLAAGRAPGTELIGSGIEDWTQGRWTAQVVESFAAAGAAGEQVDEAVARTRYLAADCTDPAQLRRLLDACPGPVAIYFALPPPVTVSTVRALADVGAPPGLRLVLEKPFGTDAASARALNEQLAALVPEDQIHRVDHFLGRSTVLNLLGLRFANRVLEAVLTAEHVERVDVVFDEQLGLEGRAGYYDGAGALVDMVQSHLLQVLGLLTMEAPATLGAGDLRESKASALRSTTVWGGDPVASSRRARYTSGTVADRTLPAYAQSTGVDPARGTETLAEMVLAVDTPRWAGVPFTLRSGKALGHARKEAVVTFKAAPGVPAGFSGKQQPERLRIGFGPDGVSLDLNVNGPGDPFEIERTTMAADFGPGELSAYGEVLAGVLGGDPTLSVRADTAEQCWRIVAPVLAAWRENLVPLEEYAAGSDGPSAWCNSDGAGQPQDGS